MAPVIKQTTPAELREIAATLHDLADTIESGGDLVTNSRCSFNVQQSVEVCDSVSDEWPSMGQVPTGRRFIDLQAEMHIEIVGNADG